MIKDIPEETMNNNNINNNQSNSNHTKTKDQYMLYQEDTEQTIELIN